MNRPSWSSLRVRLLLLFLLSSVPAVSLMLYMAAERNRHEVIEIRDEALRLARFAAVEHERTIHWARQLLVSLARLPAVIRQDPKSCSAFFAAILKDNPPFINVAAARPDGQVFCSGKGLAGPINVGSRPYFRRAVEARGLNWSEEIIGLVNGERGMVLAYPSLDEGGIARAVVYLGLSLDWFNQLAAEMRLPRGSTFTVLDKTSTILAEDPDQGQRAGKAVPEVSSLDVMLAQGREGTFVAKDPNGMPRLYAFVALRGLPESNPVYVKIGIPQDAALDSGEQVLGDLAPFGIMAVVALLLVGSGINMGVLRPVKALMDTAKQLAEGDLSARTGLRCKVKELARLAAAFDEMAEALNRREAERKLAEEALSFDMMKRERAEQLLLVRSRQLEAVRAVALEMTRELGLTAVLQLIHQRAAELVSASSGEVWLWDETRECLVPKSWHGHGEGMNDTSLRLGEGVTGTAAQRREGVIVNDYPSSPYAMPHLQGPGKFTAVLAEPLIYHDRLLGVLTASNHGSSRSFTAEDQQLLALFATEAAIAIENARLHTAALRRGKQMEALLRTTRSVLSGLKIKETLQHIVEEAAKIAGTPHVKLLLVDKDAQDLRLGAAAGRPSRMLEDFRLPLGTGLSGLVAATGQPLFVSDCQHDPRNLYADQDRELGLVTYLGLPIRIRDEIVGVLTFNMPHPREKDPQEVTYLGSFADHAAIAIENARLYEAVQQELAERERTEEALRLSEGYFRRTFDQAPIGAAIVGLDYHFQRVNAALSEITGYSEEELMSLSFPDFTYPDDLAASKELAQRLLAGEIDHYQLDKRYIRKDGTLAWVHLSVRLMRDADGHPLYFLPMMEDITEREQAADGLVKRTNQLEAVRLVSAEITRELELDKLLALIHRRAIELVGAGGGSLYLWDEGARQLRPKVWLGIPDSVGALALGSGEGLCGMVAELGVGMLVNDYRSFRHAHPEFLAKTGLTASLAEPLRYHDRLVGVIAVNHQDDARSFTEEDQRLLALFAAQAAIAIENARLYDTTVTRSRQLATLSDLTRTVTTELNPQAVMRRLLEAVQVLIPDTVGHLIEQVEGSDIWRPVASVGLQESRIEGSFRLGADEGLVGVAFATGQPVACNDIAGDPRIVNKAWAESEGLMSAIVLPLVYGDRVIGILSVFLRRHHVFTDEEVDLLRALAAHGAIALENARLFEQVRSGRERLLDLTRRVVSVQEEERCRLSRELHDEAGQALTALRISLGLVRDDLPTPAVSLRQRLGETLTLTDSITDRLRSLAQGLRPPALETLGLDVTLEGLCRNFGRRTGLRIDYECKNLPRVPDSMGIHLYRVAQEALTNVSKHAQARRVRVALGYDGGIITLVVEDDGVGFDATTRLRLAVRSGIGLIGMRERLDLLKGRLEIASQPGQGTCLTAWVPWRDTP